MPGSNSVNNYSSSRYGEVSVDDDELVCTSAGAPPTGDAESNAGRTSSRHGVSGYLQSGVTSGGDHYAGAAALKGREPTGLELEVFTLSVQEGRQNEAQLGMARFGGSTPGGALAGSVDVFTAKANAGPRNSDGSHGFNAGAVATAVGFEATVTPVEWLSLTGGASLGLGGEVSFGKRDADADGKAEYCLRVAGGALAYYTAGICIEP
jgi:hypothetical protein